MSDEYYQCDSCYGNACLCDTRSLEKRDEELSKEIAELRDIVAIFSKKVIDLEMMPLETLRDVRIPIPYGKDLNQNIEKLCNQDGREF